MAGRVFYCELNKNKGSASSERRKQKHCYAACARKFLPWEICKFNATIVDEAHTARTVGRMFVGFAEMMRSSHVRVLATATPLQHTPKVRAQSDAPYYAARMLITTYAGRHEFGAHCPSPRIHGPGW